MLAQMDVNDLIERKLVHEIHTSARKAFRGCRRSWNWTFNDNYYPIRTAKPLEFGTAYHAAMEVYYNPETWDWDRQVRISLAKLKFAEVTMEQKANALANSGQVYFDDDVELDYDERLVLGDGMLDYYFNKVALANDLGWRPVKVEIAFMVPIRNPDTGEDVIWCKCHNCWSKWFSSDPDWHPGLGLVPMNEDYEAWQGLPVVYAGRLDMLAVDENGNYWIFDWKTAARLADKTEWLLMDDQVGSYVWALRKLGVNVSGFVYHEQRKDFPQPPKRNKHIRQGRAFTISKSEPLDYESYYATVSTEDKQAFEDGLYDEILQYLKAEGTVYFGRYQVSKSWEECEQIEFNIGNEVLDMLAPNIRIYPSPSRFYCGYCAYQGPCMEKNSGGDYMYALDTLFEQREPYWVRNAPSTDDKG